jgi:hypothetical protein
MELDSITFDQFIKNSNPFSHNSPIIDLSGYSLVTPTPLVSLVAIIHSLSQGGFRPTIQVTDQQVRGYLIRSRFAESVWQLCDFSPNYSSLEILQSEVPRGHNDELFEVTIIDSPSTLRTNLKKIVEMLEHKFNYSEYEALDIATIISETAQNIYEHNSPGSYGFICFQTYKTSAGIRFLEVGLSDFGVGILNTLKGNPKYANLSNDALAIEKAIEHGTSRYDDVTRGNGLYHLVQMVKKYGGTVQIRSGKASYRHRFNVNRSPVMLNVPYLPGVHITIKLDAFVY